MRPSRISLLLLLALSLLSPPSGAAAPLTQTCTFVLGFKALHDLLPELVGDCTAQETHNPENGDGLQETANGLLVWRKADNWTAFTDGTTTWINGPAGLASRPNAGPPFPWEASPVAPGGIEGQI